MTLFVQELYACMIRGFGDKTHAERIDGIYMNLKKAARCLCLPQISGAEMRGRDFPSNVMIFREATGITRYFWGVGFLNYDLQLCWLNDAKEALILMEKLLRCVGNKTVYGVYHC